MAVTEEPERETRYLAVDGENFDQLVAETQEMLTAFPADKQHLLTRWLSLRLAMTVISVVKGSTMDSQAQITALLKQVQSLQDTLGRTETEHVDWFGPDGEKMHPDWCRECRVDRIMYGVNRALAELERHIDQPGTPPDVSNICRRVARYLTDPKGWHAPIEWESAGLREAREIIGQYVALEDVGKRYPWVSTIEALKVLVGDVRALHKTVERRGRWLQEMRAELANAGIRDDFRERPPVGIPLVRGAVLTLDHGGEVRQFRIADVRETGTLSFSVDLETVD